jgi:cytochrome oxidase Cu insertion factor (SCO1/SenC/PrrC family)
MAELNKRLSKARKEVQLISFTVDPDHDTPPVLAEYAKSSEADSSLVQVRISTTSLSKAYFNPSPRNLMARQRTPRDL